MVDYIFEMVIERLNRCCGLGKGFPNVQRVRKGMLDNNLVFETTLGEVNGSVIWDDENLVIYIGDQVVTLSLLDFLGRSN